MTEFDAKSAVFFGDWHGDLGFAAQALQASFTEQKPDIYFHVGDFGLRFLDTEINVLNVTQPLLTMLPPQAVCAEEPRRDAGVSSTEAVILARQLQCRWHPSPNSDFGAHLFQILATPTGSSRGRAAKANAEGSAFSGSWSSFFGGDFVEE